MVAAALCTALTLLSLWGRRNLAFLGLPFAWVLVGLAWIWVTGGLDDAHSDGETQLGLTLGIWSLLLITSAAVAASAIRLAERRAQPQPGDP